MGKKKKKQKNTKKTTSEEDAEYQAIYNDGLTRPQRRAEWEEEHWWRILYTTKQTKCRTEAWKIAKFDIARLTFDPRAADLEPPPRSSYICYDPKCCDGEKDKVDKITEEASPKDKINKDHKVDKITERPPEPEASPPKKSPTPPPKASPVRPKNPPKKSPKKSKAKEKEKSKVKEERSMRPSVEESREGRSRKSTVKLQARSRLSRSRSRSARVLKKVQRSPKLKKKRSRKSKKNVQ